MSRILIVEDEAHLAQGLRFNFESEGYSVEVLERGEDALKQLLSEKEEFDALVLDVMLPGKDGFSVAKELREAKNYIPLLMLTSRGRPEDVLKGFESGADDYLPKPFSLAILIARVQSLLRRNSWSGRGTQATKDESPASGEVRDLYKFDDRVVDFERLELRFGKRIIQLTMMEADLLRYLVRNADKVVTRKAILQDVWNLHEETDTRAIDNFIVRLRRYIERDPAKPKYLVTVRGAGYRFVPSANAMQDGE